MKETLFDELGHADSYFSVALDFLVVVNINIIITVIITVVASLK